jgi:hypothetical protein
MSFIFASKVIASVKSILGSVNAKPAMNCPTGFVPSVADSGRISFGAAARHAGIVASVTDSGRISFGAAARHASIVASVADTSRISFGAAARR